ncbi:hypothetical protein TYRP_010110 [Tyrophagus putrescentiae]|nr:hypothetical protein TYRP_010110 [Tyrophagus putrescentiae]
MLKPSTASLLWKCLSLHGSCRHAALTGTTVLPGGSLIRTNGITTTTGCVIPELSNFRPSFVQSREFATNESAQLSTGKAVTLSNKRIVAKVLGLKLPFLQELDFSVTKNSNQIAFDYTYFGADQSPQKYQIQFLLNYFRTKRSMITGNFKEIQHKRSEFMFLIFDPQLSQILLSNDAEESPGFDFDSITIFDDPFNALAFYQQTKLPTIVFKFPQSNKIDLSSCHSFFSKIDQRFKKIYFWSNDIYFCRNFRKLCLEHFDRAKLHRITVVEGALQMLHQNKSEKYASVFETASRNDRPGILPVYETIEDLFAHLNDKQIQGVQWGRFERFNEHLKGHRPGELTIITGPTGSGKTTFVSEYSLDLCEQGVRTLWGSFEIKYLNLERMMMTQLVGRSFDASRRAEFDQASAQFAQLPLFFMNFHGQTDIEDVLEEARHSVLMHGVEHIIIDNLQFMLGLSTDSSVDRFHKQDVVLGTVREFATRYNCHVTLVAHPRKEKEEMTLSNNSLYGGIKASQEADNILIIMNKYHPRFKCAKFVQITKNRAHGSLGVVPLYFDKNSLCFSSYHKAAEQADSKTVDEQLKQQPETGVLEPAQLSAVEGEIQEKDDTFEEGNEEEGFEDNRSSPLQFDNISPEEINYGNFKAFLQQQRTKTNV